VNLKEFPPCSAPRGKKECPLVEEVYRLRRKCEVAKQGVFFNFAKMRSKRQNIHKCELRSCDNRRCQGLRKKRKLVPQEN
jgi:hypothetical protein